MHGTSTDRSFRLRGCAYRDALEFVQRPYWRDGTPLSAADKALITRDAAERELLRLVRRRRTREEQSQFEFWTEEYRRAERAFQAAVAAEET